MITVSKPIEEVKIISPLPNNILVTGEAMAGKTTFVGDFPLPYFLSFDGNAVKEGRQGEDLHETQDWIDKKYTHKDIVDAIKDIERAGYKTIVIDTVEDMIDAFTAEITGGGPIEDMSGNKFSGWGNFNKNFKEVISAVQKSDLIGVFITRTTVEDGENVSDARKKSMSWLNGHLDGIIHIKLEDHTAQWTKHRGYWKPEDLPDYLARVIDPDREAQERKANAMARKAELLKNKGDK
ncbi:AAA family ATPase [Weissella kandleri]|uniref:AAA family ATPase n=1 Tax=Weissella kandleri TaxID=1616 RepID=UPI00387EC2D8